MIAGSLEIQLTAGIARLQKEMEDTKRIVGTAMSSVERSVGSAKTALGQLTGGLATGISVAALVLLAKRSIDAADAMNDLSQRVGIAVQDLAKYELATSQSGTTMEAWSKGAKTLGTNLLEHNTALRASGITATNVDGAMRQVADIFQKLPDGIEKTTLATKLFGKIGMELIPTLNMGSKGLDDAAEKSAKYAAQMAVMAPLADTYNDNLAEIAVHAKTAGMSLMNDLLPGLIVTTKATAEAAKEGGILSGIWAGAKALFGGDDLHKANVKTVESLEVLMGLENALTKARAEGDEKRVARLMQRVAAQKEELALHQNYKKMLEDERDGTGPNAPAAPKTDPVAAAKAQAKAILAALGSANQVTEYQRVTEEMNKRIAVSEGAIAMGRKLTDAEKYEVETLAKISAAHKEGKLSAVEYGKAVDLSKKVVAAMEREEAYAKALQRTKDAYMESVAFQEEVDAANVADSKSREQARLAVDAYAQAIEEQNAQTNLELSLVGQTAAARQIALEQYRIELELKKQIEAIDRASGFDEAQREEQRAKARVAAASAIANSTNKVLVEQSQKAAEQMETLYTDALFRAAESGKGFFASLGDTIVNTFKTMVLRPVVAATYSAGASALGFSGAANAASGASGLSSLGSLAALGSSFGSSLSAGFSATLSSFGAATGVAIEGGLASIATGTSTAIAGGLGQIAGALGPYAIAAVALYALFREKEYVKGTGSATLGFDSTGATTSKNQFGNSFDFQTAEADKYVASLVSGYATAATALGIKNNGGAFAYGSNNSDGGKFGINAAVGTTNYAVTDIKASPEALQLEASRAVFAALQGSELPGYMAKVFDDITASSATGEQISQALEYAQALKAVRDGLTETRTPLQALKDGLATTLVSLGTDATNFKRDFVAAIDAGIGRDALAQWQAAGTSMAALAEEAGKLATTNASLQDRLDLLTGAQTARSLELRNATDDSTRALLRQIYAQEDLNAAASSTTKSIVEVTDVLGTWAQQTSDALAYVKKMQEDEANQRAAVADLRNQATQQYLAAQQRVTAAQQGVANVLHSTIAGFQDVLDGLNGGRTAIESRANALAGLRDVETRARAGDTAAWGQLPGAVKTFLSFSETTSATLADYRRDEAYARGLLNEGIAAGKQQLKTLPVEMQTATDPIKAAYAELTKATQAEEAARVVAIAMQASLTDAQKTLTDRYLEAIKALPEGEGEALKNFYDNTFAAVASAKKIAEDAAIAAAAILKSISAAAAATLNQTTVSTAPTPAGTILDPINTGGLVVEDTGPTAAAVPKFDNGNLVSGQINPGNSIAAGFDQNQSMLAYQGFGQGGNSADIFNSGSMRLYTSNGVQYGTTADFASILNTVAQQDGAAAAIAAAGTYGVSGAGLDILRKSIPQASFDVGTNGVPFDMLAQLHEGETVTPSRFVDVERDAREQANTLLASLVSSHSAMSTRLDALVTAAAATATNTEATATATGRYTELAEGVVFGDFSYQTRDAGTEI